MKIIMILSVLFPVLGFAESRLSHRSDDTNIGANGSYACLANASAWSVAASSGAVSLQGSLTGPATVYAMTDGLQTGPVGYSKRGTLKDLTSGRYACLKNPASWSLAASTGSVLVSDTLSLNTTVYFLIEGAKD